MKPTALIAAFSLLASGVLAAPSEGSNSLVGRATCFDCTYATFQTGRCSRACRGADETVNGAGQVCKQCVAGCPAASDQKGVSAGYAC
ncbi:hypothetical protein CPLU01_14018 [Colletotrichum plurivorum]|uniref:4Fe-4S ferredoxin-type domain-containing protein n=1 Tax=Colletotrichum plurivorum TaxID=2175906 RepID=A0A8H6JNC6_9PEZI|nr:hypothetical protein CPLU01_14018 [Colletotrichum plurivorum]